jgi:hypothetical protein
MSFAAGERCRCHAPLDGAQRKPRDFRKARTVSPGLSEDDLRAVFFHVVDNGDGAHVECFRFRRAPGGKLLDAVLMRLISALLLERQ